METKISLIKCCLPGFDYTCAFINTIISWDIFFTCYSHLQIIYIIFFLWNKISTGKYTIRCINPQITIYSY